MRKTAASPGYALIEVLAVISVVTVLLGLSAGTIHLLLKLDRTGRAASEEASDLARLSRDFRADAHAASRSKPIGQSAESLTLALDDRQEVEYRIRPGDVMKTVREGEKHLRHEFYRRPSHSTARFVVSEDGSRLLVALVIDGPGDGRDGALYRDYRIEARVGLDRHFHPGAE